MKKMPYALCLLLLAAPAFSYQVEKSLTLPAEGIRALEVNAGAGSLKIEGVEGLSSIEVAAEIIIREAGKDRIEDFMDNHLRFPLEKIGERAVLKGCFQFDGFPRRFSGDALCNLTVRVPKTIDLAVDDGSGSMAVVNIRGDVSIEDGSGDITVRGVEGDVRVDDGSGDIDIRDVTGGLRIDDGSGSMTITGIGGSVTVDDGSGDIEIDDVGGDVILESTGSGGVSIGFVRGRVIR